MVHFDNVIDNNNNKAHFVAPYKHLKVLNKVYTQGKA